MTLEERTSLSLEKLEDCMPKFSEDARTTREIEREPLWLVMGVHKTMEWATKTGKRRNAFGIVVSDERTQTVEFGKATERIRKIIVERLKTETDLFVLFARATGSPSVRNDDATYVFTEREFATNCLNSFFEPDRKFFAIRKIPKEEVAKFLVVSTYEKGFERYIFDCGTYGIFEAREEELVPRPGRNDAIANPSLYRSLLILKEASVGDFRFTTREEAEREMESEFRKARLLVPVSRGKTPARDCVPSLSVKTENGKSEATPVFTDMTELRKVYSEKEYDGWVCEPMELLETAQDFVVVNPSMVAYRTTKEEIRRILKE